MSDIQSPLPGTFYFTPSPGEPAFKSAGDSVSEGDVIGLIEVMKTLLRLKPPPPEPLTVTSLITSNLFRLVKSLLS